MLVIPGPLLRQCAGIRGRSLAGEEILMSYPKPALGSHTMAEILSQPRCWEECLTGLETAGSLEKLSRQLSRTGEWLFIGCGSSYYIALAAAASWSWITGLRARAVPASEVLLFPETVLAGDGPLYPVIISRSGATSEAVKAADYLENQRKIRTLAVSCAAHQKLESISSATLSLLPADEQSTVMTRSFTSMLLGIQALGAVLAKKPEFGEALKSVPLPSQRILDCMQNAIAEFVRSHSFGGYVFLGQGPLFGIASEGHLKVKEMSCSSAEVYHSLEFRHGPKALIGPETLLTCMLSDTGYEAEREVLQEMKGLGATTLVLANKADQKVRAAADLLIELNLNVPEYARLAVYALAGQLLGYYTGIEKGLDPDHPRNLSRVVILNR